MADRPKTVADVMRMMKDKDVKFLDLRFTDTKGKMQHVTADGSCVDEAMFADGYAFDGSSIAGWKGIEASDMTLMPDPASAHIDPFFAQTTLVLFCDVVEPSTGQRYGRCPRSIAKAAEKYVNSSGVGTNSPALMRAIAAESSASSSGSCTRSNTVDMTASGRSRNA